MAQCRTPFQPKGTSFQFPCGSCLDCRKRRAAGWGFRLSNELKHSDTAYFITLTYDTDHVPITKNGFTTLSKKHLKNTIKVWRQTQLRNAKKDAKLLKLDSTIPSIKYYYVGEYGGLNKRPHYHIIIFNIQLTTILSTKWSKQVKNNPTQYLNGKHVFLINSWKYGHITIGQVEEASVMYTLKYISKGKTVPIHKRDDRIPEFSAMSKGIGKNYLSEKTIKWHYADLLNRYYCTIPGNIKVPMPRYFKERIYDQDMRLTIGEHRQNQERERFNKLSEKQREKELQLNDKLIIANHKKRIRLVKSKDNNVL